MDDHFQGQDVSRAEEVRAPAPTAEQPAQVGDSPADTEPGMEALLRESDYAFRSVRRGETVEGTVVRVDQDEVLVDIGLKSEGVIPSREMYSEGEESGTLQIGDRVLVYVLQPEGQEGHAVLSLRRARMERSWRDIEDLYHRGAIVEAPVVDFNKGGLIVDVKGVRGFVPVSQVLDLRNVARQEGENEEVTQTLSNMKDRRLPLKIIEINRSRNRLIMSERAAVQERRTQLKDELMDQLEPGQIRRGVVSNLTTFGAFVDLGGADGLVHVSELSYNRVNHPSEVLHVGQEVDVYVLSVDHDTKKIALSLKRALPDPWTTVDERYRVGQVVQATITKLAKFGAFAKVEEGLEGLIHLSELTDLPVRDATEIVREDQVVEAKIIHINSQRRRLGLSVRQAVEPQPGYQSYGDYDESSSFASTGLSDYEPLPDLDQPLTDEPASMELAQAEIDQPVAEQPAVMEEAEPETVTSEVNGSAAPAPEEPASVNDENANALQEQQQVDEPEVASTASQSQNKD